MIELFTNPSFVTAAIAAVVLTGFAKTGFGGGIGGLAVPILSLVISPRDAAAIMLPILILMDLAGLYFYRATIDRAVMRIIVPAGMLGTIIGWLLFGVLSEHSIRLVLGVISIAFVTYNVTRRSTRVPPPTPWKGWLWGTVSGITSFVAHSGGVPLAVYLLRLRLSKEVFVGVNMIFFTLMNAAKMIPYAQLGLLDREYVTVSTLLTPVALVGVLAGVWLNRRLSPTLFYRLVNGFLFVSGAKLCYDGARGLAGAP